MSFEMNYRPPMGLQTNEERQMGLVLHLSQLANVFLFPLGIVVPIVVWQTQKQKMQGLDEHGKMVVNWMISSTIYAFVSILLCLIVIGLIPLFALFICGIVFPIIGGLKANDGVLWEYPLTIKFLK